MLNLTTFGRWFATIFVLMFLFRMMYGYMVPNNINQGGIGDDFFGRLGSGSPKNYASEKIQKHAVDVQANSTLASNQKYEKTASLRLKTSEFEQDEKKIKDKTKAFKSVIQYEQNLGKKGERQLHLLIGVPPTLFDSFYQEIQTVGIVRNLEVTKVDKTNEYRQLNAKKTSITNTLNSLNELKNKGGQISDFVSLNEKILEIEERLQELGIELGNFDTENEFCTVRLSLYEGAEAKEISIWHRIKVALEWTIKYFTLLIVALCAFMLLFNLVEKSGILKAFIKKK